MLGVSHPAAVDGAGERFTFEKRVSRTSGGKGFADVWFKDHFAWEYKGKHKDLAAAYRQLNDYREDLGNPPLLVVCDLKYFEIHTNFDRTLKRVYRFTLTDLLNGVASPRCPLPPLEVLRYLFSEPDRLRPEATAARVTEDAAEKFCRLAESIELAGADPRRGLDPHRVAHFLMRLLFCLFADSVGLLPKHMFREMIETDRGRPQAFRRKLRGLFRAMAGRGNTFGPYDIHFFNGGLFDDDEVLGLNAADMGILYSASRLDWSSVEPSIFGTLFERSLNAQKRSQIGAHYTSPADIALIVDPVIIAPLRRRWEEVRGTIEALAVEAKGTSKGPRYSRIRREMQDSIVNWTEYLSQVRILDPACGSGNFLYVALRKLLDLWWEANLLAAEHGLATILPRPVNPRQLYGIEIDYYAHELASIVVWIGYLQWRYEHGMGEPTEPILEKLGNIQHGDAILRRDANRRAVEAEWPEADFIVSNPPFLGGNRLRQRLGDEYVEELFRVYQGRVPQFSDLVCYWFEKARAQIEATRAKRTGMIGTQGIRGGVNRTVLERVRSSGGIFLAHSDRDWVLEGANVHVSIVCFDDGSQRERTLDDVPVQDIYANLTNTAGSSSALVLDENANICFMGPSAKGDFDIDSQTARKMLQAPINVNGRPNSDVVRPVCSGVDLVQRARGMWTIDFGTDITQQEAAQYQYPFQYVLKHVKPARLNNNRKNYRDRWWIYGEARPGMRAALAPLPRYIATPATAKHRVFVWKEPEVLCNQGTLVFARDDDYFFGVLHSHVHEVWALAMGTQLEDRPRYTPSSTFEAFPLPWPPGYEPKRDPRVKAIADAARKMDQLRYNWLHPADATEEVLKSRTLTNLYNERPGWLEHAHEALDRAVFGAYGWTYPATNDEILLRLLSLNRERAARDKQPSARDLPPKKGPAVARPYEPARRVSSRK